MSPVCVAIFTGCMLLCSGFRFEVAEGMNKQMHDTLESADVNEEQKDAEGIESKSMSDSTSSSEAELSFDGEILAESISSTSSCADSTVTGNLANSLTLLDGKDGLVAKNKKAAHQSLAFLEGMKSLQQLPAFLEDAPGTLTSCTQGMFSKAWNGGVQKDTAAENMAAVKSWVGTVNDVVGTAIHALNEAVKEHTFKEEKRTEREVVQMVADLEEKRVHQMCSAKTIMIGAGAAMQDAIREGSTKLLEVKTLLANCKKHGDVNPMIVELQKVVALFQSMSASIEGATQMEICTRAQTKATQDIPCMLKQAVTKLKSADSAQTGVGTKIIQVQRLLEQVLTRWLITSSNQNSNQETAKYYEKDQLEADIVAQAAKLCHGKKTKVSLADLKSTMQSIKEAIESQLSYTLGADVFLKLLRENMKTGKKTTELNALKEAQALEENRVKWVAAFARHLTTSEGNWKDTKKTWVRKPQLDCPGSDNINALIDQFWLQLEGIGSVLEELLPSMQLEA